MAEVTHTSESVYGLGRAVGRGSKLWAGKVEASDLETLDTGLSTIEGVAISQQFKAVATEYLGICSISGGIITLSSNTTDLSGYLLVVGAIR